MSQKKQVVALGMSGGVDSSVAVHLLQKAGYEVHGIHMLMIPERFQPNSSSADDAKTVAEQFGIKFSVLDVREEFERIIIQQFGKEYSEGRTPNPCVNCTKNLHFTAICVSFSVSVEWKVILLSLDHAAARSNYRARRL